MKTNAHSKIITTAAREVLRPVGMLQKGRSRTWIADHGWRLYVVEFQPSGWSLGSYLNVACTWLWHVKDYISFDEGGRIEHFSKFQDEAQFEIVAHDLAERAATEVVRLRRLFPSVRAVNVHYLAHEPRGFWPMFNAAIASALSGQGDRAAQLLTRLATTDDDQRDWVDSARYDANCLIGVATDPVQFRQLMSSRVRATRELQQLPPLLEVDFER
jgi:hypothetical protein